MRRLAKTLRTLRPTPKRLALLSALLLVLSACQENTSNNPKAAPSTNQTDDSHAQDGYTIEEIDRQVIIKMKGADSAQYQGSQKLRIQAPEKNAPLNMMVISTDDYIDVGGNVKLSIGIVLINVYKKDGNYTLAPNVAPSPGTTPDPNNPATLSNNSRVTFYADNTSTPERTLRAYDTLTKPCPIVIRKKGKSGEVHCPEIRSVEKTTVSFDMTWGE
jgi:hypothetical protein